MVDEHRRDIAQIVEERIFEATKAFVKLQATNETLIGMRIEVNKALLHLAREGVIPNDMLFDAEVYVSETGEATIDLPSKLKRFLRGENT